MSAVTVDTSGPMKVGTLILGVLSRARCQSLSSEGSGSGIGGSGGQSLGIFANPDSESESDLDSDIEWNNVDDSEGAVWCRW